MEFEVVSDTNQLNTVFGHLALQVLPIVAALFIVLFVIDGSHNVSSREPPLAMLLVPHGPHLAIVEKPYRLLAHNRAVICLLQVYQTLSEEVISHAGRREFGFA